MQLDFCFYPKRLIWAPSNSKSKRSVTHSSSPSSHSTRSVVRSKSLFVLSRNWHSTKLILCLWSKICRRIVPVPSQPFKSFIRSVVRSSQVQLFWVVTDTSLNLFHVYMSKIQLESLMYPANLSSHSSGQLSGLPKSESSFVFSRNWHITEHISCLWSKIRRESLMYPANIYSGQSSGMRNVFDLELFVRSFFRPIEL